MIKFILRIKPNPNTWYIVHIKCVFLSLSLLNLPLSDQIFVKEICQTNMNSLLNYIQEPGSTSVRSEYLGEVRDKINSSLHHKFSNSPCYHVTIRRNLTNKILASKSSNQNRKTLYRIVMPTFYKYVYLTNLKHFIL